MTQHIDKDALVAEIERLISNGQVKLQESQESNDYESYVAWSEHIATCIKVLSLIDALEVKEDEHPINTWNKQSENDIYDSFNDWNFHKFVCLMKNGSYQIFGGMYDETLDGHVTAHISCMTNDHLEIDDINMWMELPKN